MVAYGTHRAVVPFEGAEHFTCGDVKLPQPEVRATLCKKVESVHTLNK